MSPAGDWDVVAQYDGQPNGLKIHRDGRVFIADFVNGIMELDPVNGRVDTFLITESGTGHVLTAEMDVPGEPMYSHRDGP